MHVRPMPPPPPPPPDADDGSEDGGFPAGFPFWYSSASGRQHVSHGPGALQDGLVQRQRAVAAAAAGTDKLHPIRSMHPDLHATMAIPNVAPPAAKPHINPAATPFTTAKRSSFSATTHGSFFPLDSFMSRRLSINLDQVSGQKGSCPDESTTTDTKTQPSSSSAATSDSNHIPKTLPGSFHDQDSVLHYFVATSQSERLLDQYISGLIHAFLEDPAPIYAASIKNGSDGNSSELEPGSAVKSASLYNSIDVPAGGNLSISGLEAYLNHVKINVVEKATRTSSPRMIGHMTSALPFFHRPLARLLAALNQNVVKIETSSTLTNLERQTIAMLHKSFFGMNDAFYEQYTFAPEYALGSAASGGTIANIMAIWMARNRALGANPSIACRGIEKEGVVSAMVKYSYTNAVIVGSVLMHYSFKKAADLLGLGEDGLILIPTDTSFRMRVDLLRAKIEELVAARVLVVAIVGIAGTTEAGSIDPLADMAQIAGKHGIHFHVDAAWGGPLIFSPDHRHKLNGIAQADTITIDGHKQLYTPMGLGIVLTRSPSLATVIRKTANYVIRANSPDLGKFTLEGSRPANSLYLHASLSLLGREGLATLVTRSATIVRQAAARMATHPSRAFDVLHEPMSNLLLFRIVPKRLRSVFAEHAMATLESTDSITSPHASSATTANPIKPTHSTVRRLSSVTTNTLMQTQLQTDDEEMNELTRRVQVHLATCAQPVRPPMPPASTVTGDSNRNSLFNAAHRSPGFVSRTRVTHNGHQIDALRMVIANPLTTWQDVESVVCDLIRVAGVVEEMMEREAMARRVRTAFPTSSNDTGPMDWWIVNPFDL